MPKFSSEFAHNYKTYSFGYANYYRRAKRESLSSVYASGFLPYSGSRGVKDTFYMARSARVPLSSFSLSSENRRVARKFDGHFERLSTPFPKFKITDGFINFCVGYFDGRHGAAIMPRDRLLSILDSGLVTHIVSYLKDDAPAAYVFEVSDRHLTHFWFSFYDLSLIWQSLGMWLMLDSARHAQVNNHTHFYLGTVYGEKALYKTAFKGLEYWDGDRWVGDIKKLKSLSRSDTTRTLSGLDLWKSSTELF